MLYRLDKCSSPGFEFYSKYLEHILIVLESNICEFCMNDPDIPIPDNYDSFTTEEKIHELLATSCGCEFDVSCYENEKEFYESVSNFEFKPF